MRRTEDARVEKEGPRARTEGDCDADAMRYQKTKMMKRAKDEQHKCLLERAIRCQDLLNISFPFLRMRSRKSSCKHNTTSPDTNISSAPLCLYPGHNTDCDIIFDLLSRPAALGYSLRIAHASPCSCFSLPCSSQSPQDPILPCRVSYNSAKTRIAPSGCTCMLEQRAKADLPLLNSPYSLFNPLLFYCLP